MPRSKIRVGMVHCDYHAFTFGPLMAPCDVEVYKKHCHVEYYFMVNFADASRLKTPIVPGFEIAAH
jgi:hypothetical protein